MIMQILSYPFLISAIAVGITLLYASYWDLRYRRFPHKYWYPAILFCIPVSFLGYYELYFNTEYWFWGIVGISLIICVVAYAIGLLKLCGGADSIAIIFITLFVPIFPVMPLGGIPVHAIVPLSVLMISIGLNLSIPLFLFIKNTFNNERLPLLYKFLIHKVPISKIPSSQGYIVESGGDEIVDFNSEFLPISCALRGGESLGMLDIRDIVDGAGNVSGEHQNIIAKGYVWVLYPSPFLVFITIGFFIAIVFGV